MESTVIVSSFATLPEELLSHILSYVDPAELYALAPTCRQWLLHCRDHSIWKNLCHQRWGTARLWNFSRTMKSSKKILSQKSSTLSFWQQLYFYRANRETSKKSCVALIDKSECLCLLSDPESPETIIGKADSTFFLLSPLGQSHFSILFNIIFSGDKILWKSNSRLNCTTLKTPQETRSWDVDFSPFYGYFSPCGSFALLLGSATLAQGLLVYLADIEGDSGLKFINECQPYYFSWSPTDYRILIHSQGTQLSEMLIEPTYDDATQDVQERIPSGFQIRSRHVTIEGRSRWQASFFNAPIWSQDGKYWAFLTTPQDEQDNDKDRVLLLAHPPQKFGDSIPSSTIQKIATIPKILNPVRMAIDPKGRGLAFMRNYDDSHRGRTLSYVPLDLNARSTVTVIPNGLIVGTIFSPDGRYLLSLSSSTAYLSYHWMCYDTIEKKMITFPNGEFRPSHVFLNGWMAFFDQYVQSETLFRPDSGAFLYCGTNADAPSSALFLQEIAGAPPPKLVHSGCYLASWSW